MRSDVEHESLTMMEMVWSSETLPESMECSDF